jgi:hypothetical protein
MVIPRVRSIVYECVGQENSTGASFMSGGTTVASTVKMNYRLNDSDYETAQMSEGYDSIVSKSILLYMNFGKDPRLAKFHSFYYCRCQLLDELFEHL